MKRGGVDQFIGQNTPNNVSEKPKESKKLGLE
jgi:hypothetical protein